MCGICGVMRFDGEVVDPMRVERMRDQMTMRGPDGFGLSQNPTVVLGHRRLAIIDLSAAGQQPMSNADASLQIVFNGEIYNFLELRMELENAGYAFASRTDTEVLLHGYAQWGLEGLLTRIRGMFAFALVDHNRGEIHLGRDPLGKKPLFFHKTECELIFASSLRALVAGLPNKPEVDLIALDTLLWNAYIPGPRTLLRGVEKLQPGCTVSFLSDGIRRDLRYWNKDFFSPEQGVEREEWLERIEAMLLQAVKRRLVADRPLGVMLSGGVDSGLITAMVARTGARVKTFTVAAEDPSLDESLLAERVARRYDTEHCVLPVTNAIQHQLGCLVAAMGEPMGDPSAAFLLSVAQTARQSITVALMGDGGDECFGGYDYFGVYSLVGQVKRFLPEASLGVVNRAGRALQHQRGALRRAGTLLHMIGAPLEENFRERARMDATTRAALYTPDFHHALGTHHPADHYLQALAQDKNALPVDRVMQMHLQTVLPDQLLAKTDLATMGASLEARCPFLDQDMVELAMRIPAKHRFHGGTKGLLRELARRHLPGEVVDRPKQGFEPPLAAWLRSKEWADLVDDLLLGHQVEQRGWFQRKTLEVLLKEHRRQAHPVGHDSAYLLWTLIILELWLRMTVDNWTV